MIQAYASYFTSYVLMNIKEKENIISIILFGSVAKGDATKESDVDIFIEVKKETKTFEVEINKLLENFYKSREALLFKTKSIDNKINIIAGKLTNWPELKNSIDSTGIILYGNYSPSGVSGKKNIIIFWDKIGKNRGAFLNKMYGVKIKEKKYSGLLEASGGKKLGKSCIIIPVENKLDILKALKDYEVSAKLLEVYQ